VETAVVEQRFGFTSSRVSTAGFERRKRGLRREARVTVTQLVAAGASPLPLALGAGVRGLTEAARFVDLGVRSDRSGADDLLGRKRQDDELVADVATVDGDKEICPCGTVLRSSVSRIMPAITKLPGPPIIGRS
jgi:hypothetical protein